MTDYMKVDDGGGRQRNVPVNYPSNSKTIKQKASPSPKPKEEPLVEGKVIQRKPRLGRRFADSLIGERGMEGMVETLITDILASALKGMISDAVSQGAGAIRDGVDRFLYGETKVRTREGRPYYNYAGIRRRPMEYNSISPEARARHDFEEIIIPTRAEAQEVKDRLEELIGEYGLVTVNELYDLVNIPGDIAAERWGWTDLRGMAIRPVKGGFLLKLPRTHPID